MGRFSHVIAPMAALLALASPAAARSPLLDEQRGVLTLAPMLDKVTPAVVSVTVTLRGDGAGHDEMGRDEMGRDGDDGPPPRDPRRGRGGGGRRSMGGGSGIIIDARKGLVLTNHHVIAGAGQITVKIKDGRQFKARRIGSDEATDIGLIAINASNLSALAMGDSDQLRVGDVVLAIGNPFGLGQSVSSGIVSALGRAGLGSEKYENFIQTDATINPGNSGGALVTSKGEFVGVSSSGIESPGGGSVGIGFAVPTSMARAVVEQLAKYGAVKRGSIGAVIRPAAPEALAALGTSAPGGAVVGSVERDFPPSRRG